MEACRRGKRVRFWRVIELVTHLMEALEEKNLWRLKNPLAKLDLLVLDELGYVPTSKVGATLDRLTHRCLILEANGESYRLKDAKRRHRQGAAKPAENGK